LFKEEEKMTNKIFLKKFWFVMALGLMFCVSSTDAFAFDRSGPRHDRDSHGAVVREYRYRSGRFYQRGFFGFYFAIPAPIGIIVDILPFGCRTVVVGNARYYCYDNAYYMDSPGGYVVVPAPAVNSVVAYSPSAASATSPGETVVINVPNSNGSYTPVKLVKINSGYIGPQGEYYPGRPTVDQLRTLYGS
jgi:hypothetical protein